MGESISSFLILIILFSFFYFVYQYNKKQKVKAIEEGKRLTEIICPNVNCGYKGAAKKIARGSTAIGIILCLFFLIPGIIYFMLKSGYRYSCPKCGLQIRADN